MLMALRKSSSGEGAAKSKTTTKKGKKGKKGDQPSEEEISRVLPSRGRYEQHAGSHTTVEKPVTEN